jgi:hypothetical protein
MTDTQNETQRDALDVLGELLRPVGVVRLWRRGPRAAIVAMPETAVHEDGQAPPGQSDIGPARQAPVVEPESHAGGMQGLAQNHLRLGILAPDTAHQGTAFFRCLHEETVEDIEPIWNGASGFSVVDEMTWTLAFYLAEASSSDSLLWAQRRFQRWPAIIGAAGLLVRFAARGIRYRSGILPPRRSRVTSALALS